MTDDATPGNVPLSDQLGPDGRLHADGYFTWKRRDGYVLDAKLPADFVLLGNARLQDDCADALRFRWMCRYPDWHFIEHLCRQTNASTSAEFLADLRRVIDARRSVELDPLEQHVSPGA